MAPVTRFHSLLSFRRFFQYCLDREWITEHPMKLYKIVRPTENATLPYTEDEYNRIEECILSGSWLKARAQFEGALMSKRTAPMCASLVLVMRYMGLRISDALRFEPRNLVRATVKSKVRWVYTVAKQKKTGEPVWCAVPDWVAEYLRHPTHRYSDKDTLALLPPEYLNKQPRLFDAVIRGSFMRFVEKTTGVERIRPHRFRDTFACRLLEKDVPLEYVSKLLGHTSIETTENYYAAWVSSRRDALVAAMCATWGDDPPPTEATQSA
jgi:integrase